MKLKLGRPVAMASGETRTGAVSFSLGIGPKPSLESPRQAAVVVFNQPLAWWVSAGLGLAHEVTLAVSEEMVNPPAVHIVRKGSTKLSTAVGEKVEDFELVDNTGGRHRLSVALQNGPVVLAFFPLAFTGVCTAEMCEFRDTLKTFEELSTTVYGISVDSPYALRVFAEQQALNFPLLSDFNKEVASRLGILYENFNGLQGVAKRSVFVVRPDQTVAYRWSSDNAKDRPDLAEVKDALAKL
jgi:peroxiredoxin